MSRVEDLKRLVKLKNRRLQKLKEREALFGKTVDPQILIEIEDTELEIELLKKELKSISIEEFDEILDETESEEAKPKPQHTSLSEYQKLKMLKHDENIFVEANQILNESDLDEILDCLSGDHSIQTFDIRKIRELKRFLDEISNQYLTLNLDKKAKELADALSELSRFIGKNFSYFLNTKTREIFVYVCIQVSTLIGECLQVRKIISMENIQSNWIV